MRTRSSRWLTARLGDRNPVAIAGGVGFAGCAILTVIFVAIGLSLTDGLLAGPLGRWDESINDWLLVRRTPAFDGWSDVGSAIGMTGTVLTIAAMALVLLVIFRRWQDAGFIVIALAVEVSVFLITTLLVDRSRPTVPQLEPTPPTGSFPSGHTAAAVVLFVALALILSPHLELGPAKVMLWAAAIALPIAVALARVYAGMHHVTDVLASVLLGVAALWIARVAIAVATEVADPRATARAAEPPKAPRTELAS
jgi:membrane-associated phospholipid phosphatase